MHNESPAQTFPRTTELANNPVTYDRGSASTRAQGIIRVWHGHTRLCEGGPIGPTYQAVDLLDSTGQLLFRSESAIPSHIGDLLEILRTAAAEFRAAGWHVRAAAFDPRLEVTGLSAGSGGWIDGKAYGIWDTVAESAVVLV